ncbi:hypothetical protein LOC68_09835 [Blastopirellula sp. JC732]|uniref:Uncharacterized protein n=1 Tax=Blastopirellula sediminis TaxID=2894196 RepID=A0A9X1MKG4_9BACT|nr:hypothetical protein [Blastopirellula sediminis]MCC9608525.1 hypothetical protein [Blastopirellula sediminis]MCC9628698.1 hypothetical protein [Blastopirellula sediminis]
MPSTLHPNSPVYGLDFQAAYADHCFGLDSDVFEKLSDNASAAIGVTDASGGVLSIATGATSAADNDGCYLATKGEVIKMDHSFVLKSKFKYSEAGADVANVVAIGCMNNAAVGTVLAANGAGPAASFYGAMIYKVDGETTWKCVSSAGATQYIDDTGVTAASSELAGFEIQFEVLPGGAYGRFVFLIDGRVCTKATSNLNEPITHEVPLSGATEMNVLCGGQTGSAAEEVFYLDAIAFAVTT